MAMKDETRSEDEGGVTRRRFVGLTVAGGAAIVAGGSAILGAVARAAGTISTEGNSMFKIGGDLPVNRLGFGAMRITGEGIWGWPKDREEAKKVLKRVVKLGVNLIDTADAYGPETSELLIAEALHPYPKGLVVATKGGNTRPGPNQWVPNGRPDYLKKCVDGSLKRLRLERIDLWQLHRVDPNVPMEDSLGAIKEMHDAGKIRHVGLSEVGPEEIARARKILPIATVQNRYNVDDRKWENVVKYCEKEGLGFMPWAPVGGNRGLASVNAVAAVAKDLNVSVYQVAIAWLLQRSSVMLPIPGTSSVAHLEENVAAGKVKLTDAQLKSLDAA
jgi:aryl-alcohol dehydrogenase-like predicted oxidoreductase